MIKRRFLGKFISILSAKLLCSGEIMAQNGFQPQQKGIIVPKEDNIDRQQEPFTHYSLFCPA
jgi:hypothetical protein